MIAIVSAEIETETEIETGTTAAGMITGVMMIPITVDGIVRVIGMMTEAIAAGAATETIEAAGEKIPGIAVCGAEEMILLTRDTIPGGTIAGNELLV